MIRTSGRREMSENREPRPSPVKMAPKVVGRDLQASTKLMVSPVAVTPMGMPMRVVAIMLIRIAPLTFNRFRMTISARPIRNSQKAG